MKRLLNSLAFLCASFAPINAQKLQPNNVDAILKAMTLEEKATLVVGTSRQGIHN